MKFVITLCCIFALLPLGRAQEPADAENTEAIAKLKSLVEALQFQQGEIDLKGGLAKLNLPEGFRFLGPKDAETVVTKLWGNPPNDTRPLGLIVPVKEGDPRAALFGEASWAIIVEYGDDGYIKDDDASKIDYSDLLKKMQAGTREESERRAKEGYPPIELVGWATPPRYDAANKKLYWAKELRFGSEGARTLNYNIRMLGRGGVLVLNIVSDMDQLAEIEKATPTILSMVEFKQGHRYADFQSGDKVATYGLAALVAGGILTKGGFLKALLVGVLAAKKFVVIGALALFGFVSKFFGRNKE